MSPALLHFLERDIGREPECDRPDGGGDLLVIALQDIGAGTGNGVRSVRLTFVLEASSRSCASARFQNLRIPCAAAASRTPRHPFQLLSPLTARTVERKSGQVHNAMPRSGTVESKRLSARQPFVKWTDLTPLPPFP
jgi:hypothetical protein